MLKFASHSVVVEPEMYLVFPTLPLESTLLHPQVLTHANTYKFKVEFYKRLS